MLRRATTIGIGLLCTISSAAWLMGQARLSWSILLAGGWVLANGWVIAGLCRQILCERPRRRWWRIVGYLAVKFPLLYGLGYACAVAWRPSAIGLAIGLTLGLAALLVSTVRQEQVAHG